MQRLQSTPLNGQCTLRSKRSTTNWGRLGHDVHLEKGDCNFYFWKGDANNWLDRTVKVTKVCSLTLEQWIGEYDRLKKLNGETIR
jgi:hypothetical protein